MASTQVLNHSMMHSPIPNAESTPAPALDQILATLGSAPLITYAPPNIYPMSAPAFRKSPCADRVRPSTDSPLGLYVHLPFCSYACSFCFYAKRVGDSLEQMQRYVQALKREIEWIEPGTKLTQLYVGGGTPTVLPPELLDEVLETVFARMQGGGVHTVECSPESVTDEHLLVLRRHGVGRVSMGIQTGDNEVLERIRRGHAAEQALASLERLVASGLIVNIDLIYGLPNQTESAFREDFRAVAARGVTSITAYNLRINERTPVARLLKDEERLDLARLMQWRSFVKKTAEEIGFFQTRWHTFQRKTGDLPRAANRFEDRTGQGHQFGIGMSARSRLNLVIYRNHINLSTYIERVESGQSPVEEIFPLEEPDQKIRFIALSLGDGRALDPAAYEQEFRTSFESEYGSRVRSLCAAGLVEEQDGKLALTETGKLIHDRVMLAFYPSHVIDWLREREQVVLNKTRPLRFQT
jgi:oxygen-independent coproporphyrinogen III oxidase